jgi:hypothetical protein
MSARWVAGGRAGLLAVGGLVVAGLAVAGCTMGSSAHQSCPGYVGCSSEQSVGVQDPTVTPAPAPKSVDDPLKGPGCGLALPADQPTTIPGKPDGYKALTVMGTGATLAGPQPTKAGPRTFWVRVPADYDPNHAYPVVYIGGGYGVLTSSSFYPLYDETLGGREEAIYVAVAPPADHVNLGGYDDADGPASQEWEAFQLFQTIVDHTYCVDDNHLYAVGYEAGGNLADMWGCYFAGDGQSPATSPDVPRLFAPTYHLRGQGAVAGAEPTKSPSCNGPVAFLGIHDQNDTSAPFALGLAARDRALSMNGCAGSPTAAWPDDGPGLGKNCAQYTACPQDYPVVFCETSGLGNAWQANIGVPAFTLFFKQLESLAPTTP